MRNVLSYKKQNTISKALLGSLFNLQIFFSFLVHSVVWEVNGGGIIFPFPEKCLVQLNSVTELNYLVWVRLFSLPATHYENKVQNKTSQKANIIVGGYHHFFGLKELLTIYNFLKRTF